MGTSIVVRVQARELAKIDGKQLQTSSDFYEELNKKVEGIIKKSCERAKANGRTTVMGKDV